VTDPTPGDMLRRFEDSTKVVSARMAELTKELREDRLLTAATYVRQDVYAANERANANERQEIRKDVSQVATTAEEDRKWRRNVSVALAGTLFSSLTAVAVTLFNYVTR
jgi:hypothetical protein